jgi:signal transduction histidine kinase
MVNKVETVDYHSQDEIQYWREKIYNSLSLALVILGFIAYIPSAILSIYSEIYSVFFLDTVAYLFVLFLFFNKKVSYLLRVFGLLMVLYLLGVLLLIMLGTYGAGWIWLFAFAVFASLLKGFRAAVITILINLFTIIILGILIKLDVFHGLLIDNYKLESWYIVGINFICLNGLVSIPIAVLLKALELSLDREKEGKVLLEQEQQNLSTINKDLTRTNKDLDNFIYTASHDLKSPISNIEGLIHILKDEVKSFDRKDLNDLINLINISVNKFKTTIQSIAEVAKVQKNVDESEELLKVADVLEEVKFSLSKQIEENNPKIQLDLKAQFVKYSKKNFTSILYNLISNAIKYKDSNRVPEIVISTRVEEGCFVLSVKDNGLGMKPDYEEKIFKMFKRMHDHVEGTGIGLYILKRIVDNSGGKIKVFTELGKGSEFQIFLKL